MPHVLEHRDIKSHGLELTVQKQGALLLKEFVNYKLFMTKTAENLTRISVAYLLSLLYQQLLIFSDERLVKIKKV